MENLIKLDRYIIKKKCGSGGMSTVYLATDPELEMDVAIKILAVGLLEREALQERFKREAKMLALLNHPAIVPILNFGEVDGKLYFVMPYLPGGSLRQRLADGPIPLVETIAIVERIASALEAAHEKRIIHRDVKPHNILFDEAGQPFLADFGVARLMDQDEAEQTVTLIGTPEFMSPEQVLEGTLTPRTDVYQLGVVIFQMLTGWLPFEGGAHHVMTQHLHAPVPSILALNPDLPPACEAIIQQAMAKDPRDRYETAVSLGNALAQLTLVPLQPEMIPELSANSFEPSVGVELVRRRPFLSKPTLSLLIVGLLLMAGLGTTQIGWLNASDDTPIPTDTEPIVVQPELSEVEDAARSGSADTALVPEESEAQISQSETAVNTNADPANSNPPPPPNNSGNGNRGNGPRQNDNNNGSNPPPSPRP